MPTDGTPTNGTPTNGTPTDGTPTNGVHRVVGAMLVHEGSILLCHRTATRAWLPDVWDLAGGHIEDDESPAQALVRECREELGIDIAEPAEALDRWQDDDLDLTVFRIAAWNGEVTNAALSEHDRLAWFAPGATVGLELADERYRPLFAAEAAGRQTLSPQTGGLRLPGPTRRPTR
jgi:8-oxo-dGTP diphosphatase